ncbi:hypothetical protein IQ266_02150 [filamentous cyanobacterium LEGE 11480]|uniref:Uncharacterized protein n=1 Tax=Romeriopsis navalis LEGE 11480 TaxID=2777977 RepID=A0A928VH78_9CYAN|nr:hypothetical protein [Romeriopsis navalis]MBE9028558.1 hypothetical protein [Romeriopsis navalis LEGE 11480]
MTIGLVLAIALGLIHGFASQLPITQIVPMHRWTSFAGGVSIVYVFLEVFPELAHAQKELVHAKLPLLQYLENHIYIAAVIGLVVFYGLDLIAVRYRQQQSSLPQTSASNRQNLPFWIHLFAFASLNAITGYLLQSIEQHNLFVCILFFITTALHFFIIDEKLREHYQSLYDRIGRWVLVGALMTGAVIAQVTHLSEVAIAVIWSFFAGSIILNVLKRELPEANETCFNSFIVGVLLFAALLNFK